MSALQIVLAAAAAVVLLILLNAIRIVPEYQRGVIFRLGRIIGAKGPGLFFIIPVIDRMVRVDLRTQTVDIPPQDVITADNVTVRVNAVTYFNVTDPNRSVVAIEDYRFATFQVAQTTLRSILGQTTLDELLGKRDDINLRLRSIIDEVTNPWGVAVSLVEVKDVNLPESMQRAMGRQAEAERERRAKVIHALGEKEAAQNLGEAALVLEQHPAAMQLRTLASMVDIAGEHNSTMIFPVPMEMLRLFQTATTALQSLTTTPDTAAAGSSAAPLGTAAMRMPIPEPAARRADSLVP